VFVSVYIIPGGNSCALIGTNNDYAHKTQDEDKQNKKTQHNIENYKDNQHGSHQKPEVNPGACEG
jgi:hypothetical protein